MKRRLLHFSLLLFVCGSAAAQFNPNNYRTIDGSHNNIAHPDWGAAGENLLRFVPAAYADGISSSAGANRPNPRLISNTIFAQPGLINDPKVLSDFCWVWGQFIDHDFGLTDDGTEPAMIQVPQGDPWFDPMGTGQVMIPMTRNKFDVATGTSVGNPRQHPNELTAFVDASGVYGSDEERAAWLRTFIGGKLRTSSNNLMPFNTITGEFDSPINPGAPKMANPVGLTQKFFVGGDVRANENPLLAAIHTIFVREHNLLCEELSKKNPGWNDEQLYQHARKLVSGSIQAILYEEWLPALGVTLPTYQGYDPDVNPQLMNLFTGAAFRLGHTLLNGNLLRVDENGNLIPEGSMPLRDAFFNPLVLRENKALETFLKGMAIQTQQQFDSKVVDDVRNFLFGPPGAGGLDLAAININRGRERGLPDFNTVRQALGLPAYSSFNQINTNAAAASTLQNLYGNINNIDLWVGLLSETPMPNSLFGETLLTIMQKQFAALRDGDRFYYENDPVLTAEEKAHIKKIRLHYIIMRNTGVSLMQDQVFKSMPHSEICNNLNVDVTGKVYTYHNDPISDAKAKLGVGDTEYEHLTDANGKFHFDPVRGCDVDYFALDKDDNILNGVSTYDLVVINRHLLGIKTFDSPYQVIAADVDGSEAVSIADLISIRRAILQLSSSFPLGVSWRFIPADHEFENALDPFDFEDKLTFDVMRMNMVRDFVGVKLGDLDGNANPNALHGVPEIREGAPVLAFHLPNIEVKAGEIYQIPFTVDAFENMAGYQFALGYEPQALEFLSAEAGALNNLDESNFGVLPEQGLITSSWIGDANLDEKATLFTLTFRAQRDGQLSEMLTLNNQKLRAEAYSDDLQIQPVALTFDQALESAQDLIVYQNRPNPVANSTIIPFQLPEGSQVRLTVLDITGRILLSKVNDFSKGYNEFSIDKSELKASGLLLYKVESGNAAVTKKMLILE
ncbi:MAG: T9SS type A sorting domain-containing protein [Saprospiraceae bacterium]|nr:T9SS type A sorting domain-containing protein [Saprospiraceae bacterium]